MNTSMFPEYSPTERRSDAAIHIAGLCAIPAAIAYLMVRAIAAGSSLPIAAAAVYSIGLASMIGASAAYHMARPDSWKEAVRRADRTAIYLKIAGTYTPFALVALGGSIGWYMLAAVWLTAAGGIVLAIAYPRRFERIALALYLALGWLGLPIFGALVEALPPSTLALVIGGGLLYTGGVLFHVWNRLPGQNAIWHGFVLAASACHYVAVVQVLGT